MSNFYKNEFVCPYCKHEYSDDIWEYAGDLEDGDKLEIECEGCGNPFFITLWIDYSFEVEGLE